MTQTQKGGARKRSGKNGDILQQKPKVTIMSYMSRMKVWQLLLLLLIVVTCVILFAGAVAGWFNGKRVVLDEECYCDEDCNGEFIDIDAPGYERLVGEKKSFILLIDQGGCKTADNMRGFIKDYAREKGVRVYRMMFDEMKETPLHDNVKYYPSVVLVGRGRPIVWLRADKDEDVEEYNDYNSFKGWIERYLDN